MRIAGTIQDSIVDGPGLRFTLFTQGCRHNCPGCQNPQTHDYNGGEEREIQDIVGEMLENPLLDGLTLSGGEPFDQADSCTQVAEAAKNNGLNVWTYSGYTFEELCQKAETQPEIMRLLKITDVLIDGEYVEQKHSFDCKWRGSTNQRIIDVAKSLKTGKAVEMDV